MHSDRGSSLCIARKDLAQLLARDGFILALTKVAVFVSTSKRTGGRKASYGGEGGEEHTIMKSQCLNSCVSFLSTIHALADPFLLLSISSRDVLERVVAVCDLVDVTYRSRLMNILYAHAENSLEVQYLYLSAYQRV